MATVKNQQLSRNISKIQILIVPLHIIRSSIPFSKPKKYLSTACLLDI